MSCQQITHLSIKCRSFVRSFVQYCMAMKSEERESFLNERYQIYRAGEEQDFTPLLDQSIWQGERVVGDVSLYSLNNGREQSHDSHAAEDEHDLQ